MRGGETYHGRAKAQVQEQDALPSLTSPRQLNDARYGSARLLALMNRAFEIEADRLGIYFEDARLLLMNGVRL